MDSDFSNSPRRKLNLRSGSVRSDSSQASNNEQPVRKILKAKRRTAAERNELTNRDTNFIDSNDEEEEEEDSGKNFLFHIYRWLNLYFVSNWSS